MPRTMNSISEVRRAAAFSDSLLAADDEETSDEDRDVDLDDDDDVDDNDSYVLAKRRRLTLQHPTKHARNAAGFSDSSGDDDDGKEEDDDGEDEDEDGNCLASFETCASDLPIACCPVQSISEVRPADAFGDSFFADDDEETKDEDLVVDLDDDDDDSCVLATSRSSNLRPSKHARNAAGFSDSSDDDDDKGLAVDNAGIPAPRVSRPSGCGTASAVKLTAGAKGLSKPPRGSKASKKMKPSEPAATAKATQEKRSGPTGASKASKMPSEPTAASKPTPPSARRRTPIVELKKTKTCAENEPPPDGDDPAVVLAVANQAARVARRATQKFPLPFGDKGNKRSADTEEESEGVPTKRRRGGSTASSLVERARSDAVADDGARSEASDSDESEASDGDESEASDGDESEASDGDESEASDGDESEASEKESARQKKIAREMADLTNWCHRLNELIEYKNEHGDCDVPQKHPPNAALGWWVKKQRTQKKFMDEGKKSSMTPSKLRALEEVGFTFARRKRQSWAKRKSQPSTDNRFMEGQYDSDASSTVDGDDESLSGTTGDGRVVAPRQPTKPETGAYALTAASVDAITDPKAPEGGGDSLSLMTGDGRVVAPSQPFDPEDGMHGPTAAEVDAILNEFYRTFRG